MSEALDTQAEDYVRELACEAPPDRVFEAVATLAGLRGWWTPLVVGSTHAGGQLHFGFEGLDEVIVMRVDDVTRPSRVRWTCLEHSGDPAWKKTTISIEVRDGPDRRGSVLAFRHAGLSRERVKTGWERFLASLGCLVDKGEGEPYGSASDARRVARAYHSAWTHRDFASAERCLSEDLQTDVPLNTYETREAFVAALTGFGSLVRSVDLLAEFASAGEVLLVYDMHTDRFGTVRVAEEFTINRGRIQRIRHVHDTFALREAAA